MKHDEIEIFNAHFLPHGATIGTDLEARRVENYVKDFTRALPKLRHLRTSLLVTHKQHTDDGINLSIRLLDLNLRSLFNPHAGASANNTVNEFEREVAHIQQAIELLPTAIAHALSPAVSPTCLRVTGAETEQIRALRKIFLRSRGLNIFSGLPKPQLIATGPLFAQGTLAIVQTKFETLRRGQVKLKDVLLSGQIPPSLQNLNLSGRIWMSHAGFQVERQNSIRFLELMETSQSALMEVLITWDSVSGQPHHLEFRKFLTSSD